MGAHFPVNCSGNWTSSCIYDIDTRRSMRLLFNVDINNTWGMCSNNVNCQMEIQRVVKTQYSVFTTKFQTSTVPVNKHCLKYWHTETNSSEEEYWVLKQPTVYHRSATRATGTILSHAGTVQWRVRANRAYLEQHISNSSYFKIHKVDTWLPELSTLLLQRPKSQNFHHIHCWCFDTQFEDDIECSHKIRTVL